jgi:hypothetical protein
VISWRSVGVVWRDSPRSTEARRPCSPPSRSTSSATDACPNRSITDTNYIDVITAPDPAQADAAGEVVHAELVGARMGRMAGGRRGLCGYPEYASLARL